MKQLMALIFLVLATGMSARLALADQYMGMHGGGMANGMQMGMSAWSEGTVRRVTKESGKVIITHSGLENLGMPAMTMVFRVKDTAWLDRMRAGDHVRFIAGRVNGMPIIVNCELIK